MMRKLLLFVLAFCCGGVFAATDGSITFQGIASPYTILSSSCSDVLSALGTSPNASGWRFASCSADPLTPGSTVGLINNDGRTAAWVVVTVTASPPLDVNIPPSGTASVLYNGTCYPSPLIARSAVCSASNSFQSIGSTVYSSECVSLPTDTNMTICTRVNGGACVGRSQPWPYMAGCTFDGGTSLATDYLALAMGFLVIIWGGKKLVDLFEISHTD